MNNSSFFFNLCNLSNRMLDWRMSLGWSRHYSLASWQPEYNSNRKEKGLEEMRQASFLGFCLRSRWLSSWLAYLYYNHTRTYACRRAVGLSSSWMQYTFKLNFFFLIKVELKTLAFVILKQQEWIGMKKKFSKSISLLYCPEEKGNSRAKQQDFTTSIDCF